MSGRGSSSSSVVGGRGREQGGRGGRTGSGERGENRRGGGNGDDEVDHASCPARKVHFPSVHSEDGQRNGYEMMREAKRGAGWDISLKFGKSTTWLNQRRVLWFSTGMFRKYEPLNSARLSSHINSLCSHAKSFYPTTNHSADEAGGEGKDIPAFVLLCREWKDHKSTNPSVNVQQQVNRFALAVAQQSLMDPRPPLREPRTYLPG